MSILNSAMGVPFFDKLAAFNHHDDGAFNPAVVWLQKNSIVIAALVSCAVLVRYCCGSRQTLVQEESQPLKNDNLPSAADIVPLQRFRWDETEPLAYRPFKSQYHLTMGKFPPSCE